MSRLYGGGTEKTMTNLKCSVTNCGHNKDNYCCKESILVEGENASTPASTRCSSFVYKPGDCFCGESPKNSSNIECSAETCVFNKNRYCEADSIHVGNEEAKKADATECDSFVKSEK